MDKLMGQQARHTYDRSRWPLRVCIHCDYVGNTNIPSRPCPNHPPSLKRQLADTMRENAAYRNVLEFYRGQDDGTYQMLQGFNAKKVQHDPRSLAGNVLDSYKDSGDHVTADTRRYGREVGPAPVMPEVYSNKESGNG